MIDDCDEFWILERECPKPEEPFDERELIDTYELEEMMRLRSLRAGVPIELFDVEGRRIKFRVTNDLETRLTRLTIEVDYPDHLDVVPVRSLAAGASIELEHVLSADPEDFERPIRVRLRDAVRE